MSCRKHWPLLRAQGSRCPSEVVAHLRAADEAVRDELLVHTSPLTWEHIGFSGDFLWDHAAAILRACKISLHRCELAYTLAADWFLT